MIHNSSKGLTCIADYGICFWFLDFNVLYLKSRIVSLPFQNITYLRLLTLSKMVDKRIWGFESPLRQFPILNFESLKKIEDKKLNIDKLREMEAKEIGKFNIALGIL